MSTTYYLVTPNFTYEVGVRVNNTLYCYLEDRNI